MLLRKHVLDAISAGQVDLVFRRWKRPTVKTGGTLRTPIGLVQIQSVEKIDIEEIDESSAKRAGVAYEDLIGFLEAKDEGHVYRVELGGIVPDPRVALREEDDLGGDDIARIVKRLDRLDSASKRGQWTRQFLTLLADNPHVRAQDLADRLGLGKTVFKNDVRKLKALGLTISHSPGYELSPRGRALLDHLKGRSNMDRPQTDFNPRFSGPDAKGVPWSEARRKLEHAESYWISTVRPDGRPHVTPLVGVWHEEAMYFATGPDERKAQNLAANPWCVLTTGTDRWDSGFDVVLEGVAHRVVEEQHLEQVADAYRAKYGDSWSFRVENGTFVQHGVSHVYEVLPATVFGFGKSPFSQTRYRFDG